MKLTREASGGESRYFLPNEANKSFRINKIDSEEVQKDTGKGNETPKRGVMQWLLERFGRCKSGMASNQKGCRAEQSEAGAQAYRPVL